jgi:midasin (ATPase involved in ribosome maturation)
LILTSVKYKNKDFKRMLSSWESNSLQFKIIEKVWNNKYKICKDKLSNHQGKRNK